jgi:flagellar hook-associated protein 2
VVTALAAQHGQNAGSLSGDTILITAQQVLSHINGYSNNGNDLSKIGLDLDKTGHITFNAAEFTMNLGGNFSTLSQFLGDSTTGFIHAATTALDSLEDPITGSIKSAENVLSKSLSSLQSKINDQVAQINQFQQNLYDQLAKSDAAVYSLDSQVQFFTQMFATQNANAIAGH